MKIKYRNPGDKYSTDSIIEFMREGEFWTEPIFHFYPDLMKHEKTFIKDSHREEKLRQEILNIYENRKVEIEAKVLSYQEAWDLHEMMINESFSNIFQLNSSPSTIYIYGLSCNITRFVGGKKHQSAI